MTSPKTPLTIHSAAPMEGATKVMTNGKSTIFFVQLDKATYAFDLRSLISL